MCAIDVFAGGNEFITVKNVAYMYRRRNRGEDTGPNFQHTGALLL